MANSISKTDIINMALASLGQDTISSPEEETAAARTANLFYDVVRRNLLRAHDWSFSLRWEKLDKSPEPSPFMELPYVFARPADCLFLKKITYEQIPQKHNLPYRLFVSEKNENLVACPYEGAIACYVKDEANESVFDPAFVACFALFLAAELAIPVTGDSNIATLMYQKYQAKLEEARLSNKVEQFEKPEQTSIFVEAR